MEGQFSQSVGKTATATQTHWGGGGLRGRMGPSRVVARVPLLPPALASVAAAPLRPLLVPLQLLVGRAHTLHRGHTTHMRKNLHMLLLPNAAQKLHLGQIKFVNSGSFVRAMRRIEIYTDREKKCSTNGVTRPSLARAPLW